jgi:hypothetical protein
MGLKEIHAQQGANNLEALGPLLAAYAESYFYRESQVFRNLRRMPEGIEATAASLFAVSPTKVARLDDCEPRNIQMHARPAFSLARPLPEEKYNDIISCLSVGVDRMFLGLVRSLADMPALFDARHLEQFFADCQMKGQFYFGGIECRAHFDKPRQRLIPDHEATKFKLDEPWYEVSLSMDFGLSLETLVVPTDWALV